MRIDLITVFLPDRKGIKFNQNLCVGHVSVREEKRLVERSLLLIPVLGRCAPESRLQVHRLIVEMVLFGFSLNPIVTNAGFLSYRAFVRYRAFCKRNRN